MTPEPTVPLPGRPRVTREQLMEDLDRSILRLQHLQRKRPKYAHSPKKRAALETLIETQHGIIRMRRLALRRLK